MAKFFHVTSSLNRPSILANGLDWRLMGAASGIAGSTTPEQEGCFLCEGKADVVFFVNINNTGGLVDVWAVDGVAEDALVESGEGFVPAPFPIGPEHVQLLLREIAPVDRKGDWRWPEMGEH